MSESRHCFVEAKKELSFFSDEELKGYLNNVVARAREYSAGEGSEILKGNAAVEQAIKDITAEKDLELFGRMQQKINDKVKSEPLIENIKEKKVELREVVGSIYKNLSYNIEAAQKSSRKILSDKMFGELDKNEWDFILNNKNDRDIWRALDGATDVPAEAKQIANKMSDYVMFRTEQMVASDALLASNINPDRFVKATHDPALLMNGGERGPGRIIKSITSIGAPREFEQARTAWKDFIKVNLNLEKTFRNTNGVNIDGSLNSGAIDEMLDEIYNSIITENPVGLNTSNRGSNEMFFYWKNHESFHNYSQRYGKKDLFANLMADVNRSGDAIGTAEIFGSNPNQMYDKLVKVENKYNPVSRYQSRITTEMFKNLTGIDRTPISSTVANFGSSLRALTAMKSLGRVALVSLGDIANGVAFSQRWGFDYWSTYTDHLAGQFNLLGSADRIRVSKMFKEHVDHHMGYVSRFVDSNNIPMVVEAASSFFYRAIGLTALDRGNKVTGLYTLAKNMGELSNRSWKDLPAITREQMAKFDFGEREWDVLRTKNTGGLFTLDNIKALSDDEIRKMYGATDAQSLTLLKSTLHRKLYSMFDTWADNTVLKPSAYMRTWVLGGTRAGTLSGELMRTFMQFKMYSFSYFDKMMYQGLKDQRGAGAKLGYTAMLVGSTMPMAFLSYWLNNLAQGKSLPSWDRMNTGQRVKASMEIMTPLAGMFNQLYYKQNQGRGLVVSLLNTPALQELSYAMSAIVAASGGDGKAFKAAMKHTGMGLLPFTNAPILDPYFKAALGEKAHLEPGQVQLYGR